MNQASYEYARRQAAWGSPVLALGRLLLYGLWTGSLMPVQWVAVACHWPIRHSLPRTYHRACHALMGLDVVTRGTPSTARPTLFVSNHCSYLDISVLGGLIEGSFVAKNEVAGWPLFGLLAKLQQTVFVDRGRRGQVDRQRDMMRTRLEAGDNLILFPEGTSSDGNRLLPFKTALFAAASVRVDGRPVTVQPVSVTPIELDGIPMGRALRPFYAWYGDMALAPHLWTVVKQNRITVAVEFHQPVSVDQFGSRKALADHCWHQIAGGISRAIGGLPRREEKKMALPAPEVSGAGAFS